MTNDIAARCLRVLSDVLVQDGELAQVAAGGPLFTSASLDSLSLLNLVVALEKEFAIQIMAENLDEVFASLASLTDYLNGELGA